MLLILVVVIGFFTIFRGSNFSVNVGSISEKEAPEILNGGGCLLYESGKDRLDQKYLFIEDFDVYGYMKLNDKIIKFTKEIDSSNIKTKSMYSNKEYDIEFSTFTYKKEEDFLEKITGKFILYKKNQIIFDTDFVGYCGP